MQNRRNIWWSAAALLLACGGGGSEEDSRGGSGSDSLVTSETLSGGDTDDSESGSGSGGGNSASNSNSDSNSGGSGGNTDPSGGGGSNSDGVPNFDIGVPDVNLSCGGGGGGGGGSGLGTDFSYIWVANSPEGTVSKINTQTLVEEGRYLVRADGNGNPSRTSVNLNGDMAVANRNGGVTMIRARLEDCPAPANTSTGADDVKAWQDGCIGWHTAFAYDRQRPMAWTQGNFNDGTCRYEDVKLWTSGAVGNGIMDVVLMDGETGVIEQTIPTGETADSFGIYGGAVDSEGNFWGSMLGGRTLFRVTLDDFAVTTWPAPQGYGMTVDPQGRAWTCGGGVSRFTLATETWDTAQIGASGGGCMVDAEGILWVAGSGNRLLGVDIDSMGVVQDIAIPGYAKGISIDFEGNVWAVSTGVDAWRVNPTSEQIDTFTGLTNPYSYSDMTGFALSQAGGPAE